MRNKFRSIELTARKLIDSFDSGGHVSSLKDSLVDIDSTRFYQPGDKKLDSKTSLRTNQTMSRVFIPDKTLTVFLMLDVSASQFSKIDQVYVSALYLLYLAELLNDSVGIMFFSNDINHYVEPTQDSRQITSILERNYGNFQGQTDLSKCLNYVANLNLRNSLFVLLSDFCYDIPKDLIRINKRILSPTNNNQFISLVLVNRDDWLLDKKPFSVNFRDAEHNNELIWNLRYNKDIYHKWQHEVKLKLRQAMIEPIFSNINNYDYLIPLIRYFLRGN